MSEELDLVVSVEQPPNHAATLANLKSKISRRGEQITSPSASSSKPKCPKFPNKLLPDVKAQDYAAPKRISGPYHHGDTPIEGGETLKLKLAAGFIHRFDLKVDEIYNSICNRVRELKACYEEETAKKFRDEEFTEMMLVDGCALLWYILCVYLGLDHEDYDIKYQDLSILHQDALLLENQLPYELLQKLMESVDADSDAWTLIFQEFFGMMEESSFQEFIGVKEKPFPPQKMKNYCCQVDRLLLKGNPEPRPELDESPNLEEDQAKPKPDEDMLRPKPEEDQSPKLEEDESPRLDADQAKPNPDEDLSKAKPEEDQSKPRPCHHLLDLDRRNLLGNDERSNPIPTEKRNSRTGSNKKERVSIKDVKEQLMASFRNVKELMDAGIRIKPSHTLCLRDISFTSNGFTANLRLPIITIDKSTKTLFFNLIAHEMSSDVPHDFISYLRFLDSLIDHADDVKELQSARVLQNNLGTHEEVAEFFNTVSANLDSNFHAYREVRVKIRKHLKSHYKSKRKRWITQCLDNYFSSPWTIIAWIVAALALFFTAVQTYFSTFSR